MSESFPWSLTFQSKQLRRDDYESGIDGPCENQSSTECACFPECDPILLPRDPTAEGVDFDASSNLNVLQPHDSYFNGLQLDSRSLDGTLGIHTSDAFEAPVRWPGPEPVLKACVADPTPGRKRKASRAPGRGGAKAARQRKAPARTAEGGPQAAAGPAGPPGAAGAALHAPAAGTKPDRRGQHWKEKALAGVPLPTPSAANAWWAEVRRRKEAELGAQLRGLGRDPAMPWGASKADRVGSTGKVLYMLLVESELRGRAEIEWAQAGGGGSGGGGFFGILRATVPPEHRAEWDAGPVPSAGSLPKEGAGPGRKRKSVAKMWQTAGFEERAAEGGGVVFEYSEACRQRLKAQQT